MYIKEASRRIGFLEMLIHKEVLAIRVWQPAAERTALAWGHKRSASKILILPLSFPYGMNTYLWNLIQVFHPLDFLSTSE